MMQIVLQINHSEKNAVSKNVETVTTLSGTLKDATSIIDPVIMIEYDGDMSNINYLTIPEFDRFYFITNITSIRNGLWMISAHVDVLRSFASEIRANSAVIRRQENAWNLYLDDGIFKTYQNPIIQLKAFPSGFTTEEFVLAVAGS